MSKRTPLSEGSDVTRRDFLLTTALGLGAVSAASVPFLATTPVQGAVRRRRLQKSRAANTPETLMGTLYESMSRNQRRAVMFPFDDPRRTVVSSDWRICEHRINETFNSRQQAMIHDLFMGLHSPLYASAVMDQVQQDNQEGGLGSCTAALFGEPGSDKSFEFVLTGRHVTRRCCAAGGLCTTGGPVFLGGTQTAYRRGLRQANELFKTLTHELDGWLGPDGIATTELWSDQKKKVLQVLAVLLAPLRFSDVRQVFKHINDSVSLPMELTVCRDMPHPADNSWCVKGPTMAWYFRSEPCLHTWFELRNGA